MCSIVTLIRRPFHVGDRSRKGVLEDHLQHAKGFFFLVSREVQKRFVQVQKMISFVLFQYPGLFNLQRETFW